jgi:hypothetical protein
MTRRPDTFQRQLSEEQAMKLEAIAKRNREVREEARRKLDYPVNMYGHDQSPEGLATFGQAFPDWLDDPPQGGDVVGLGKLFATFQVPQGQTIGDQAGHGFIVINAELKKKGLRLWTVQAFEDAIRRAMMALAETKDATEPGNVPAKPMGRPSTPRSERVRRIMIALNVRETRAWNIEKFGTIDGDQQRALAKVFADHPQWSNPQAWAYRKGRNTLVR